MQAVIGVPIAFVANLIVVRSLGSTEFGKLAIYIAAYSIISGVANAGISDATIQWGAAAYARGDRQAMVALTRRCAGYHIFGEAPVVALAAAMLLHGEAVWLQLTAAATVALTQAIGTPVVVMTAMSLNARLAKLNLVLGTATQLAVITAAVGSHDPGPVWVARVAVALCGSIAVSRVAPGYVRRASLRPMLPRRWPEGFARYAATTFLAGMVTSLVFSRSEIFVLQAYGNSAAVGVFALSAGLAGQITAPVDAMLGPLVPAAASLVAVDRTRAGAAVTKGLRLSALFTAPLCVFVIPALTLLVPTIYGHAFGAASTLFIGLAAISCFQSVLHPVTAFMTALRRPTLALAISLAGLTLDLGLVALLGRSLGATGALIGNVAGQVLTLGVVTLIVSRHLAIPLFQIARALLPFLVVETEIIACTVLCLELYRHGLGVVPALALAVVTACVASYLTIRAVGGLATSSDIAAISGAFARMGGALNDVLTSAGLVRVIALVPDGLGNSTPLAPAGTPDAPNGQ